ncbi:MAG: ISAs1 family transposase [Gaiellaceae bacterium]
MGRTRRGATSECSLVVRPITADERERFDETLRAEHWLGAGLVGEVMRYVATENGVWCALVGFGSAALCVRSREELLCWSDSQRHRRLRYVTNNQRFCVLEAGRRANLASEVLALCLRRLSGDFEARWGHPVVVVETFTDPARHLGTCYKASNFTRLGETSGYGRKAGRFVHHGGTKAYWLRPLRRDALRLLSAPFDHPVFCSRRTMSALDLNRLDLDSPVGLLARLETIPDPRKRRGVRHRLAVILAIATLATLRGATSLVAIGEVAAELPEEALRRLCCRISPSRKAYVAPEESTIRRTLKAVDANAVDVVVNAWIADQVRAGRLATEQAPLVELAAMVERDETEINDEDRDSEPALLRAVAVDGKTLRGARTDTGRAVHLLSAMTHAEGATIAQRDVDQKTNEITGFRPLLESLDLNSVVVTADAMHAQRDHARFLVDDNAAHYVFGLKGNQPTLAEAAERLLRDSPVVYETHDKGHGRTEHRYFRVATIPEELAAELGFPSARQFIAVERERADLADRMTSMETSYYVTDLRPDQARPAELASYIRGHWGIENRSHFVRDRVFDEDRSQVRVGGAPQVLATLRNLAISILRLNGFKSIAVGLRWVAWDHHRGLKLLGL